MWNINKYIPSVWSYLFGALVFHDNTFYFVIDVHGEAWELVREYYANGSGYYAVDISGILYPECVFPPFVLITIVVQVLFLICVLVFLLDILIAVVVGILLLVYIVGITLVPRFFYPCKIFHYNDPPYHISCRIWVVQSCFLKPYIHQRGPSKYLYASM